MQTEESGIKNKKETHSREKSLNGFPTKGVNIDFQFFFAWCGGIGHHVLDTGPWKAGGKDRPARFGRNQSRPSRKVGFAVRRIQFHVELLWKAGGDRCASIF